MIYLRVDDELYRRLARLASAESARTRRDEGRSTSMNHFCSELLRRSAKNVSLEPTHD